MIFAVILYVVAVGCIVTGIAIVAGAGWAFIASGVGTLLACGVVVRGLTA